MALTPTQVGDLALSPLILATRICYDVLYHPLPRIALLRRVILTSCWPQYPQEHARVHQANERAAVCFFRRHCNIATSRRSVAQSRSESRRTHENSGPPHSLALPPLWSQAIINHLMDGQTLRIQEVTEQIRWTSVCARPYSGLPHSGRPAFTASLASTLPDLSRGSPPRSWYDEGVRLYSSNDRSALLALLSLLRA